MEKMMSRNILLSIFLLFILLGISFALVTRNVQIQELATQPTGVPPTIRVPDVPYEAMLEGTVVCLPHKDSSGPQTLECAIGLQTGANEFYAFDANGENPPPYNTGQRISAQGIVTPAEMLSTDRWQKYTMKGIFSLRSKVTIL